MSNLVWFYWQLILRRAPILVAIVLLFTGFGLAFAVSQPDRYKASARLLVESAQIPDDLAASTVETGIAEQLGLITQRLTTRANFIDIANKLDVYPAGEDGNRPTPNAIASSMRKATTVRTFGGRNRANYVDISFESSDPNIAAGVVNELVTRALDDNVRMRTQRAGDTLDFFEQEVERLSNELSDQSARLSRFKSENADSLPEALNFRLNRESNLEERLISLQREANSLTDQRERVEAVYKETGRLQVPQSADTPEVRQLRALEVELSNALAVYSESNPKVAVLRTRINQLRDVVAGQSALDVGSEVDTGSSVYDVTLAEIDARAKALNSEIEGVSAELERLRINIEKTPQTSIGLQALERDYRNIQAQYNTAVSGLARAKTGEQIELTAKGQRISVVENAVPPQNPSSPNRKVITSAGGLAGVAVAVGLFALLELLNSSIRRPAELVNRVGITPFATIPDIQTARQRRFMRIRQVFVFLLVFIVLPATLYLVDQYVISLGEVVQRLRDLI